MSASISSHDPMSRRAYLASVHDAAPGTLVDTVLSGNAWKVRLMASYLGTPITRASVSIVDGDMETDEFAVINPVRQVPVFRTREGSWLSESTAIMWYLAKGTPFLPEDTPLQAQVVQWLAFEETQHMHNLAQPRLLIALRKTMQVDDPRAVEWRNAGYRALRVMESHLSGQDWFVGGRATVADVALYPYTSMAELGGYDLSDFPATNDWLARMRALPGYTPLVDSPDTP